MLIDATQIIPRLPQRRPADSPGGWNRDLETAWARGRLTPHQNTPRWALRSPAFLASLFPSFPCPSEMSAVANGVPQIVGTDEFHARIRCATLVGHKVWCGEEDGTVTVRTPKGWEERRLIRKGACVVTDIAAVGDEAWVGYSDGFIRVYDAQTQAMTKEFCQHEGPVHCMCVHQGHVYTGGADYKIYQWDPATCEFTREYAGHGAPVRCLAVAAMQGLGKKQYTLLVSGADDGTIRVWRPHSVQEKLCRHVFYGHSGAVSCMTMVHDKLWSGSHDGHVKVWGGCCKSGTFFFLRWDISCGGKYDSTNSGATKSVQLLNNERTTYVWVPIIAHEKQWALAVITCTNP